MKELQMKGLFWPSVLLLAVLLSASCGGSSHMGVSPTGTGRVRMVIHWPETRAIPSATQSLLFRVMTLVPNDDNQLVEKTQVKQQVAQRPSGQTVSEVILEDLPSVRVRIKATAHESSDGTGTSLAMGSADVTVLQSGTVSATLELSGGTVFNGSVNLTTQASVNALAGVTEITSDLNFPFQPSATDPITSLAPLASLQRVGRNLWILKAGFSSVTNLSLPALTEVGGDLLIAGSFVADVHGGSLTSVTMPALQSVGGLNISGGTSVGVEQVVTSISLPALGSIGSAGVQIDENPGLEQLTLGPLEILDEAVSGVPQLFIQECPDLRELHLGSVTIDGSLVIKNCPMLETATGSGTVGGDLIINGLTSMTTEEIGAFQRSFSVGGSVVPDFR